MIKVTKSRKLIPAAWATKAADEVKAAASHYAKWSPRKRSFKFKVYRDRELKKTLVELFNFKCAYCEFLHKGGYSPDIDHWRPKSAVRVGNVSKRPGYYWLGAEWDNLFPSCRYCNSSNRHEGRGIPEKARGKLDQFPTGRVRHPLAILRPGKEKGERPLLLNPSKDDPRQHLVYSAVKAEWGVVKPRAGRGRAESAKGRHSIDVYVLDRKTLVDERRDLIISLLGVLNELEKFADRHRKRPGNPDHLMDFVAQVDSLRLSFLEKRNPYLAVSRQFALPVLRRLRSTPTLRAAIRVLNPTLPPDSRL